MAKMITHAFVHGERNKGERTRTLAVREEGWKGNKELERNALFLGLAEACSWEA